MFILFSSTEGNLNLSSFWSKIKSWLALTPVILQICGREKAIGFPEYYLHAFQENQQGIFSSNFLAICGHHPHNQNRKPSVNHRQRKKKKDLYSSQLKRSQRNWSEFSLPAFSVGPQCDPDPLCWSCPVFLLTEASCQGYGSPSAGPHALGVQGWATFVSLSLKIHNHESRNEQINELVNPNLLHHASNLKIWVPFSWN